MNADKVEYKTNTGMLHRWLLTLALALMFGLSQQGALVHEISHFDDVNPLSQHQDHDHDKSGHTHYCPKCESFSALASSVGVHAFVLPLLANDFELHSASDHSYSGFTFLSYAARAPPGLS